jgi:hypothetical protein
MGTGVSFPWARRPGDELTDHSLASSGKVSNDWSNTSTPLTYLDVAVLHYADGRFYIGLYLAWYKFTDVSE